MSTKIVKWNPKDGPAFQGDIAIVAIPASIAVEPLNEIMPIDNRLIIQEGEQSGHHHAINLVRSRQFRQDRVIGDPVLQVRDTRLKKAFGGKARPTAHLYRDTKAIEAMRACGILTRTDLAIGCLVIEGGSVVISHEEHDGIRVPPGSYYLGRQVESAGAEERIVTD